MNFFEKNKKNAKKQPNFAKKELIFNEKFEL